MERPRAKHRQAATKNRPVPSHLTIGSDVEIQRPRPSAKFGTSSKRYSMRRTAAKSNDEHKEDEYTVTSILQSVSSETKEETDDDDEETKQSESGVLNKHDLLSKLNKFEQKQTARRSDFGRDLDEIKQFISSQSQSASPVMTSSNKVAPNGLTKSSSFDRHTQFNRPVVPTSLKLIGLRDPKSLLYHRQYGNNFAKAAMGRSQSDNSSHHRAQSSVLSTSSQEHALNDKYHHLRSFSSIMQSIPQPAVIATSPVSSPGCDNDEDGDDDDDESKGQVDRPSRRNDSVSYVESIRNRQPSELFGASSTSPVFKMKKSGQSQLGAGDSLTLQQLASEYESDSDEEQQDDDLDPNRTSKQKD